MTPITWTKHQMHQSQEALTVEEHKLGPVAYLPLVMMFPGDFTLSLHYITKLQSLVWSPAHIITLNPLLFKNFQPAKIYVKYISF